jgi:hypothetical protein
MARFQIVLSPRRTEPPVRPPAGRFGRVKAILAALLMVSVLIGFLLAALLLGSIIAALLIILVVVAFAVALVKAANRGPQP